VTNSGLVYIEYSKNISIQMSNCSTLSDTEMELYLAKGYDETIQTLLKYNVTYCNDSTVNMILQVHFDDYRSVSASVVS
jgi:hypothetical protein